jgi:hypothetical protein
MSEIVTSLNFEQICIQLACTHLDVTEVGKMAALLVDEFEAASARRMGSAAGGHAASAGWQDGDVRMRLFESADGGLGNQLDQDSSILNARINKCIKSLQRLCRQCALSCSVALVCAHALRLNVACAPEPEPVLVLCAFCKQPTFGRRRPRLRINGCRNHLHPAGIPVARGRHRASLQCFGFSQREAMLTFVSIDRRGRTTKRGRKTCARSRSHAALNTSLLPKHCLPTC